MSSLPLPARLYVGFVISVGSALLYFVAQATFNQPYWFLALSVLACAASAFKVTLPLTNGGSTMSISSAIDFFALIMLGPHETMLVAAASAWTQCNVNVNGPKPIHRTLFSMASLVITVQAAGVVFAALGGVPGHLAPALAASLPPLVGAALAYFVVNTTLVAIAIALSTRQSVLPVWNDNFLWSAPSYFVGAAVAAGSLWAIADSELWLAWLALPPLYLSYRSYQVYLGRVERERRHGQTLSSLNLATIEALARAIDAKDQVDARHLSRIQHHAAAIAQALGMSDSEIEGVRVAALLHDIGKLAVPEHILSKPGPLTAEEFQKVRLHPQIGAQIVEQVPFPYPVASLIMSHHERWDGKGYPQGLKGEDIPLGARILAAADYYEALTSDRPYHRAMTADVAVALLQQESGKALDPAVVAAFVAVLHAGIDARRESGAQDTVFDSVARAHRELFALYEIAQTMGTTLGVSDTMALIASKLGNAVPFTSCALFLADGDGGGLRCRFATGVEADAIGSMAVRVGQGLTGWVARNRRSLVNASPSADFEAAGLTARASTLQSALMAPLVFNDRFIGTLAVYQTAPDYYTDDHRRLLERVCDQAAAAIHNAVVFEQTQEDSLTDPLTALPNTRFMFMHLTRELARAERLKSEVALLVMDLDNFKDINDTCGHHTGDRALREVAAALRGAIRPYDICVRYAGDEFIVVLSGCGPDEAERKRGELQRVVDSMVFELRPGQRMALEISVGAAVYPQDGDSYEALLATADSRMYRDKTRRKQQSTRVTMQTGTNGHAPVAAASPTNPADADSQRPGLRVV